MKQSRRKPKQATKTKEEKITQEKTYRVRQFLYYRSMQRELIN